MKQEDRKIQERKYFQYNQRLNKLLALVLEQVRKCKIPASRHINPNVFINTRARKRYGACKLTKINGKRNFTIEISSRLYNSDDKTIQGVIAHEILHTCNGAMNHGEKWKRYAQIMNQTYGYNIKRVSSLEEMGMDDGKKSTKENNKGQLDPQRVAESKYVIKCKKCGNIIYRMRKSNVVKNPENYRCQCGGQLEVYTVKIR